MPELLAMDVISGPLVLYVISDNENTDTRWLVIIALGASENIGAWLQLSKVADYSQL